MIQKKEQVLIQGKTVFIYIVDVMKHCLSCFSDILHERTFLGVDVSDPFST